ncbi:hypothetical protein [Pontimonas sp.]|uniref:hypothetical protein n=1 Tax=Pontimonas sp. TaxID=2304492 RepID=UPI0028701B56|nr:hypothetical protein [Pontimonas sp.]MDR9396918.1 hypothetical protein [Pontimonas sp.]MDR9434324.1 hypothetical protein [Pontimonas sp.]
MSAQDVIRKALLWGVVWTTLVTIVASVAGALVADLSGMLGALLGGGIGFAFLAITPLSIVWGLKAGRGNVLEPGFFAVVLGMWLGKFVIFLALVFWLGDLDWAHRETLFLTIVASLLAGLATDVVVVIRSRMPYVDVPLPNSDGSAPAGSPSTESQ